MKKYSPVHIFIRFRYPNWVIWVTQPAPKKQQQQKNKKNLSLIFQDAHAYPLKYRVHPREVIPWATAPGAEKSENTKGGYTERWSAKRPYSQSEVIIMLDTTEYVNAKKGYEKKLSVLCQVCSIWYDDHLTYSGRQSWSLILRVHFLQSTFCNCSSCCLRRRAVMFYCGNS